MAATTAPARRIVRSSVTYHPDGHSCSLDVRCGDALGHYTLTYLGGDAEKGAEYSVVKFGGDEYRVRVSALGRRFDYCTCPARCRPFCRHTAMIRVMFGWGGTS